MARVQSQSLLDVIDTVIDKGLAVDAEIVLGLADIDLIYLRVGALLAAADRVFSRTAKAAPNESRRPSRIAIECANAVDAGCRLGPQTRRSPRSVRATRALFVGIAGRARA